MTRTAIFNISPSSPTSVFFSRPELFRKCVWICESFWLPLFPWHLLENLFSAKKIVLPDPASSYNLPSCQGLSGRVWGSDCPGWTQHGWSRGRVCQEDKPQPLSRQWWALKSSDPPLLRLNRESGSNRGHHTEGVPHQVVASRYDGSAWSFGSLGKTLHSKPGLWRLSGCIMAAWSCLLSRLQKI